MLDILYGTIKSVKSPYKKFYKEYKGLAKKGFDVISSQFSFHYYLESRESFDGYLKNIQENLNHGRFLRHKKCWLDLGHLMQDSRVKVELPEKRF